MYTTGTTGDRKEMRGLDRRKQVGSGVSGLVGGTVGRNGDKQDTKRKRVGTCIKERGGRERREDLKRFLVMSLDIENSSSSSNFEVISSRCRNVRSV